MVLSSMPSPTLRVASSLDLAASWHAARLSLGEAHVSSLLLSEPRLSSLPSALWTDAEREDVTCGVRWSAKGGLEETSEERIRESLSIFWPEALDEPASRVAPLFCSLADSFGKCLAAHSLLEQGDATTLRVRCVVQRSSSDFGHNERFFHRDHLPLRLVSTLHGDGTVVIPDEALVSPREWREVCRQYDYDEGARPSDDSNSLCLAEQFTSIA